MVATLDIASFYMEMDLMLLKYLFEVLIFYVLLLVCLMGKRFNVDNVIPFLYLIMR